MPAYRLNAINQCLDAIGEAPVNDTTSDVPDAQDASRIIDRVTRQVLSAGWSANSAFEVTLTPDMEGTIRVPDNILSVDTSGKDAALSVVTQRDENDGQDKLFKVVDQTFSFTDPVTVDIVYLFDIDALPFALQNYITALSAKAFQKSVLGATSLNTQLQEDVDAAWALLLDYESGQEDNNVLTDSPYMRVVTGRNNPLSGR